ncbi:MAG: Ig-like domain-containing protein [Candidatus Saganbacteria bacterium]|nr:Ig-like domain-containing protein [Candidatus Saganbacteria bacterium]
MNEAVADDDGSYIWATATGRNLFSFPAFSVPAGSTINFLRLTYRHERKQGGQTSNIRSALLVGGNNYDTVDPGVTPTANSWATRTYDYATNPKTGLAWAVDDINGVGSNALQAYGVYTNDVTRNPYVTQVYATVDYTPLNTAPILNNGSSDNVLPALSQYTDGTGRIAITFRIKDGEADSCGVVNGSFEYQVNGGGWNPIADGDITGTKTNLSSATDYSGTLHTLVWDNSKEHIDDAVSTNVQVRFNISDGALTSADGTSPSGFNVDNLDPAALAATDITSRPQAGGTTVILDCSFTESNPNTNTFYLALNGPTYGAGTAGQSNTADPSAQAVAAGATLDGNDYISKVRCVAVDDFGNVGINETLAPANDGVTPYTPPAPTVDTPTVTTVNVTVNKNASEASGLEYAIRESGGQYVQAGGTLGGAAVWQTIAAWGTKTVTGLSAPVSNYVFSTKSRNPNGDNPESSLSGGASSANTAPALNDGSTQNQLPVLVQATDRSGRITFTFRIRDLDLDDCSVVSGSVQYQVNGGGWNNILDADVAGTKTGLSSASDMSGTLHTLVWDNSKEYIDDAYSQNVQIRFQVDDGSSNSTYGVSPTGFNVDNLDPAVASATDIQTQPRAGQTTVTLSAAFTEINPDTNTFDLALNGGAYGSPTTGEANTATPSPQATAVGATLDGNDYVSQVKCTAVDDFGNIGDNENTSPSTVKQYIKPYTPAVPTVSNGTATTADVKINKYPAEVAGLEYSIYVSSHNKYVQTDGTLGDSAAWQPTFDWGTITVTGLSDPVSDYYFKVKSRNTSDAADQTTSQSDLSDAANTTGLPPVPEGVVSYFPSAGADNVSPEAVVSVTFDRDMSTLEVQAVFSMEAVYDNSGNFVYTPVSGAFSWARNRVLTFTPAATLSKGYTYRVRLSGPVKDFDGNDLTLDLTWTFRTVLDRQISNIFFSADGRTKVVLSLGAVSNDAYIDINRNPINDPREIDPAKITEANAKVLLENDPFKYPFTSSISEINAYGTDDVRITSDFAAPVTISLYYDDENDDGYVDNTSPRIMEKALKIYRLDEDHGLWIRMPNSIVDADQNCVSAVVSHFSVYTLMATAFEDVSAAYAYPNPFKPNPPDNHTTVTFTNLGSVSTIKIFTLRGDLVKTINETDGDGVASWNVQNDSGEALASGLYLYVVKSGNDIKRGKLLVIK